MSLDRRSVLGAALAMSGVAFASPVASDHLLAVLQERNRLADAINGGLTEGLSEAAGAVHFDRLHAMEDVIDAAPVASTADVRAKLALVARQIGEEGLSVDEEWLSRLLVNVVRFLEAN